MVIYSRKPTDKPTWANNFTKYMKKAAFDVAVKENAEYVYRTTAIQCKKCFGRGHNIVLKKDGTLGKACRICKECNKAMYPQMENVQAKGSWIFYLCKDRKCENSERIFEGKK